MKAGLTFVALIALALSVTAQNLTNRSPAKFAFKLTCYLGSIDSGTSSGSICCLPETIQGSEVTDVGSSPGREYKLNYKFQGHDGGKDVYWFSFQRKDSTNAVAQTSLAKEIRFDGSKSVIYKDEIHIVVIDTPGEEECKAARKSESTKRR